jgi:hypothetical protein
VLRCKYWVIMMYMYVAHMWKDNMINPLVALHENRI